MASTAFMLLSIVFSSLILVILVFVGLNTQINAFTPRLYARQCGTSIIHNTGIPIIGLLMEGQMNICSSPIGHLTILNEVNNSRCPFDCASAAYYVATLIGNGSKPTVIKTLSGSANVALKPGNYTVIAPQISGFYEQTLSPNCSGKISAGESIKCTITNSYSNNIQTWIDKLNNIKILFSYSPQYPFVGNLTQLSFQAINSDDGDPLQISHIRVAVIKNVTANFNTSKTINDRNNFVTYENISSNQGLFSLNYTFTREGAHQIILEIIAKNNEPILASFSVPVLLPE